jgi:hypothetical protein
MVPEIVDPCEGIDASRSGSGERGRQPGRSAIRDHPGARTGTCRRAERSAGALPFQSAFARGRWQAPDHAARPVLGCEGSRRRPRLLTTLAAIAGWRAVAVHPRLAVAVHLRLAVAVHPRQADAAHLALHPRDDRAAPSVRSRAPSGARTRSPPTPPRPPRSQRSPRSSVECDAARSASSAPQVAGSGRRRCRRWGFEATPGRHVRERGTCPRRWRRDRRFVASPFGLRRSRATARQMSVPTPAHGRSSARA